MASHPFITLLRSPSASFERIDKFLKDEADAAQARDPHTRRTALHVLCANVCLADEDSMACSSVLLLARRIPEALSARDLQGATPLELLVDHGGLTTALLMQLIKLRPEITREPLRIGSWWEQRRETTLLQWVCAQHDVNSGAVEDLLSADHALSGGPDEGFASRFDSWTGRSALHALCENEQLVAHNWADFLKALRALAAAAPQMVLRADRHGLRPCDLLEQRHLLRGEALAVLVDCNTGAAASRLALPPWEQSEWATRKPPAEAAAEEEQRLSKETAEENERRAVNARYSFEDLAYGLSNSRESECTAAAIQIRRLYEQGDAIVRQAAVDTDQLCASLVKVLHRPRCSAPRVAAQRALSCLSEGDLRLAERIKNLKAQEMQKARDSHRQMREQMCIASDRLEPQLDEPKPELQPKSGSALKQAEISGHLPGKWRYEMTDGEWEYVARGESAAMDAVKPNFLHLEELLEQSRLAQSRKEGLQKLDNLTQTYKAALVKLIMDDEQSKMDNKSYLEMKEKELEAMGVAKLRGEATDRGLNADSYSWLRGKIGELIPNLIELLRGLDDDNERLAALQTLKQIVRDLACDRKFLHALPQLTAAIFFLRCGPDGVVFAAANECLDEIIACSTHRRLVNIAEEAVGIRNEDRVRNRAMNCLLQMLLQWPVAKLARQEVQFRRILLVVMDWQTRTTPHMKKIARRAAMVLLHRMPENGADFRAELGPSLGAQVDTEEMWALEQLRNCTFGIGNVTDSAVLVETSGNERVETDKTEAREQVDDANHQAAPLDRGVGEEGSATQTKAQLRVRMRWKKAKAAALVTAAGYNAAVRDAQRTTPLHWLCASETVSLGSLNSLLTVLTLESRLAEDAYRRIPLHVLCANRLVTGTLLETILRGQPANGDNPKEPSRQMATSHVDETKRTPLHHLCSNQHAWTPEKINKVAKISSQWSGWDQKDCNGRTPLDLLALNRLLNAVALEALVNSGRDIIAKLKIFTTPDEAHAPITVDEDSTCSVSPLHWLCMQHSHASERDVAVSSSTLQKVVDAFPDACAVAGPAGNTPLHLLCMGEYTTSAHLLTISAALSSCWEEQNENGDRPLDLLVAERRLTPATVFDLIKHTPRVAEVPMKDMRNPWSKEPITVLHWMCYTVSRDPEPDVRSSLLGHLPASVDYREHLRGLILEHGQIDHEGVWRRDLAHLKKGALRKRALLEGVPAYAVDEAEESYAPKTALVDLIVARLQTKDDAGVALRAEVTDLYSKDTEADQKASNQKDTGGTEGRERPAESSGNAPVRVNALHNRAVVVGLQLVIGAFPDAVVRQDEEGRTPLQIYCSHNAVFADAINVLAKQMTDRLSESIHFRDAYSNSALDLLLAHGALSVDLLEKLVGECSTFATGEIKDTHGPDCSDFGPAHVTKLADGNITPLHWLCAQPNLTLKSLQMVMVAAGSTAAQIDGRGQTPLHYLCKNKAAAAPEVLALFQTLNESAVAAIDSKQVVVSQASAENMVGRPEFALELNAGDKARDILASKLAEQTNHVRSIRKKHALNEKQRRRAAEAASASPRAVRQAQDHVDRRSQVAAKTMKSQSVQKSNRRRTSIRGAHFLSAPRRSLHAADTRQYAGQSMAEIIAGIPDDTGIEASAGRFQLQHSWQQLPSAGHGDRLHENVNSYSRSLVDWAAKDHSGMTALHLLCTNPTRWTRELLCWAAGSSATTAAWSVPNCDGRTPLDVLQFTCRPENEPALTAKLLKELVVKSDGRLAAVPLREPSDAPVVPMEEPTPGDLSLLAFACGDPLITEQDLAEITYAYPQALIHTSGKLRRNPLHILCANPHAKSAHIRCLVLSPCGREAVAAQDAHGNTSLHLLCQNARAVREDACAVLVAEYTPVISVQNRVGRLPIHYAASLGIDSGLDAPELECLLKLLSVAPSMPGRKRPKRRGRSNGLAPTRDVFGHTPLEILARNGHARAGLVKAVAGQGKLGVSDGRSDALIGEAPIGAVEHQSMR
eukprot:COSAG02_NODE_515_length_20817_cov_61.106960_5_plen_1991_part_00